MILSEFNAIWCRSVAVVRQLQDRLRISLHIGVGDGWGQMPPPHRNRENTFQANVGILLFLGEISCKMREFC